MKMQLVVMETVAHLVAKAENQFEKDMLTHVEGLPKVDTYISTTQNFGRNTDGELRVVFSTIPKTEQPVS